MTALRRPDRAAGVYVHIPYCSRLCPYCDFAVAVRKDIDHAGYVDALLTELEHRAGALEDRSVSTLYFGGGTPSLLDPHELSRFARELRARVGFEPEVEVTLEANPQDVTPGNLAVWTGEIGIDRLSIGVQSFDDDYLDRLGRNHDAATAHRAVERAVDAVDTVSIDLIYAGPEHTLEAWRADLATVEQRYEGLDHVSTYHLTVEQNTVFARRARDGDLPLPDEDAADEMMDVLDEAMDRMGLEHYEVSSYARPGKWSRHNSLYWTGAEYLGLGVGAHSLSIGDSIERRANPRRLRTWLEHPTEPAEVEPVPADEHLTERLFLAMRTRHGVDLDALQDQLGPAVDPAFFDAAHAILHDLVDRDLVEASAPAYLRPTPRGMRFADAIAVEIMQRL